MHAVAEKTIARVATPPAAAWLGSIERWLTRGVEAAAVLVLLTEVVILGAAVTSRYIFHNPIIWTDELASVLFVWLSMLGAVIALVRGEHMRLGLICDALQSPWRERLEAVGAITVLAVSFVLFAMSYEHFESSLIVTLPVLDVSDGFRSGGLLVGSGLMSLLGLIRLNRMTAFNTLTGIVLAAVVVAVLWGLRGWLLPLGNLNLIVFFVVVLGSCVAIGVPIAFAFAGSTILYLWTVTDNPLAIITSRIEESMSSIILLAIPLFVLLGVLIEMTGLARALVDFMAKLLGHIRGGLSFVLLGAMFLVSGISGSKTADMAAVAPGLLPEMKRRGSHPGDLAALLSATGAMTETIPPSLVLIMIGSTTGISIAALFAGGLIPAVLCSVVLGTVVFFRARRSAVEPLPRASAREILRALLLALPALLLPVVIRVSVAEGIATATEVSTIGVLYAAVVGPIIYRGFEWRRLYPALVSTASLSGAIMIILGVATAMAWSLTQSGFSHQLVKAMTSVPGGAAGFLGISIVGFVVLGSILEGLPAILLFAPLMFPAARVLGIHDIHYAMVIIIAMGVGLFAPPFGIGFYAACAIAGVPPEVAVRPIWPYLGGLLIALIILACFPWFATALL
jgi:tripartite ATP-independent transporter DctM subunit